ncbi:MAG: 1-acyl-sn-glycerol-3-phosphate acyltransferase, partial [bacterium]
MRCIEAAAGGDTPSALRVSLAGGLYTLRGAGHPRGDMGERVEGEGGHGGQGHEAWPEAAGRRIVFLLDAASRTEERLLHAFVAAEAGPAASEPTFVRLPSSRRRSRRSRRRERALGAAISQGDDPLCVPLRLIWDRDSSAAERPNPVREILTIGDPRDPGRLRARWLHFRHPDRCRVVSGEAAVLSDLRSRWLERGGRDSAQMQGLAEFVELQAQFALERAERRVRGSRYKVPRLVSRDILGRPGFRAGIARLALDMDLPPKKVASRAADCLQEIAASHRRQFIELTAQLIHMLYTRGYEAALRYDRARLEELYELAQRHTLVFLPSHKSNLDHLVLQYALHENGHPPNHTAGGINMNFFPLGPLVRRAGIFFIRRTFQDDPIYKFVIRQYIDYLVEKRFTLEWYIEGGRSRTGKLLPPRLGLLAYVADAYRRGKADDVLLVPVSIAYDQIQDVGDYVAEQSGVAKKKEGFGWFLGMIRSFQRRFGRIHIGFGEVVSLREYLGPPMLGDKPDTDAEKLAVQKLAFEVAVRINRETPITPTSLLTFDLLGI